MNCSTIFNRFHHHHHHHLGSRDPAGQVWSGSHGPTTAGLWWSVNPEPSSFFWQLFITLIKSKHSFLFSLLATDTLNGSCSWKLIVTDNLLCVAVHTLSAPPALLLTVDSGLLCPGLKSICLIWNHVLPHHLSDIFFLSFFFMKLNFLVRKMSLCLCEMFLSHIILINQCSRCSNCSNASEMKTLLNTMSLSILFFFFFLIKDIPVYSSWSEQITWCYFKVFSLYFGLIVR